MTSSISPKMRHQTKSALVQSLRPQGAARSRSCCLGCVFAESLTLLQQLPRAGNAFCFFVELRDEDKTLAEVVHGVQRASRLGASQVSRSLLRQRGKFSADEVVRP